MPPLRNWMINYLVHPKHSYTLGTFLQHWAGPIADRFRVIHHSADGDRGEMAGGVYIFSDLERLDSALKPAAIRLATELAGRSDTTILNNPEHWVCRYDLLGRLLETGRNQFRARRWTESRIGVRYPVFLRPENEHSGSLTALLFSELEVIAAADELQKKRSTMDDVLLVEFIDTADENGIYRKYSCFRVGDRIVPRHLIFSRNWMLKYPDLLDGAKLAEEREFLEANPHEHEVREAFDLGGAQYGRIDYGMLDGNLQVWEINTNPMVMMPPVKYYPQHMAHQEWFATQIRKAFVDLDDEASSQSPGRPADPD
jgi:hypothetical protein